ncbi:hypothetical protein FHETE_1199 [Fusarium heterosporum]|uniref:Uncharacterized protein n=1 Tax=Fusarium heterosporum TaxID=42747 RepID=A0A8H5X051_FUSHE|nr:hypothetical protein FHETE_1199 [Fusarium heterosporum]
MPNSNRSHHKSVGFLDALGMWTMGSESSRRSSRHGSRHGSRRQGGTSSTGSTAISRAARLDNAPSGLHRTASQWRQYADVPPGENYGPEDGDCDCAGCHEDEGPQPRVLELDPQSDRFRSAWPHSEVTEATRARRAADRRVSRLNRTVDETASTDSSGSRLRHQVSYDANNDALFANLPRSERGRQAGEIIVHRQQGQEGLDAEVYEQREMYLQPVRNSRVYSDLHEVPPVPQDGFDVWPSALTINPTPQERLSRIQSWQDGVPENSIPEAPMFGGSNAPTIWPGPRSGEYAGSVIPDDSLTEVMRRQLRGRDLGDSRAGDGYGRRY